MNNFYKYEVAIEDARRQMSEKFLPECSHDALSSNKMYSASTYIPDHSNSQSDSSIPIKPQLVLITKNTHHLKAGRSIV